MQKAGRGKAESICASFCCRNMEKQRLAHFQVDPTLTRADRLVGQVLGEVGALPDVFTEVEINFFLLRRLLGVRTQVCCSNLPYQPMKLSLAIRDYPQELHMRTKLSKNEVLMLNIGSMCTGARVIAVSPRGIFSSRLC